MAPYRVGATVPGVTDGAHAGLDLAGKYGGAQALVTVVADRTDHWLYRTGIVGSLYRLHFRLHLLYRRMLYRVWLRCDLLLNGRPSISGRLHLVGLGLLNLRDRGSLRGGFDSRFDGRGGNGNRGCRHRGQRHGRSE